MDLKLSDELLEHLGKTAAFAVVAKADNKRRLPLQAVTSVELIALTRPGYYHRRPNTTGKVRHGTPPTYRPAGAEFCVHWQDAGGGMHKRTWWVAVTPKRRL